MQRNKAGVALVVVLAFVVLLTGVVVAFFSRALADRQLANSSSNQAKADQLARSALNIVTGDLKQEVVNGSNTLPNPNPNNYPPVYSPKSIAYMVPARNGVPKAWSASAAVGNVANTTLLRISSPSGLSGTSVFIADSSTGPFVDHAASASLSTDASANGRSISRARWNQHYLLPLYSAAAPTDTTPDPGFVAPSWVYVTASKGPPDSTSANPALTVPSTDVLGRYAYAIYDEGALLDANVAGFPADVPTSPATSPTMPPVYAPKGALAFADLTMLAPGKLTQAGINALVGWRNYASMQSATSMAQPGGSFPAFTFTGTTTMLTGYKNMVLSNPNGFASVSTVPANGQTDQAFLGRQQLINHAQAIGPTNFNPNALFYLGTFSRAVNAPSWSPSTNAANGFLYKTNAESPTSINRNLANVRWTQAATIKHYNDDGTPTPYAVKVGDPMLQSRFSLARLAWLTPTGPASGKDEAIQACFGLHWVPAQARWEYVGATGTTPVQDTIERLDQVAAENREPNFFEVLKAGILQGSLGKDPGAGQGVISLTSSSSDGPCGLGFDSYSANKNKQIIQIGTNIIDQYDADSYPTAIYFKIAPDPNSAVPEQEPVNMCYGVENLPYLAQINQVLVQYAADKYGGWYQPELWNPHQAPPASAAGPRPSKFRVVATGQAYVAYNDTGSYAATLTATPINFDQTAANANLYFDDAGGTGSAFYAHPQSLNVSNADTTLTDPTNYWQSSYDPYSPTPTPVNHYVGFRAGTIDPFTPPNDPGNNPKHRIIPNPMVTFCLQYQDSSLVYRPYNYFSRIQSYYYADRSTPGNAVPKIYYNRPDPRTDRFSASLTSGGLSSGMFDVSFQPKATTSTITSHQTCSRAWPAVGSGFHYDSANYTYSPGSLHFLGDFSQNQPQSDQMDAYYTDPDGAIRPGDGFRRDPTGGNGCPLYDSSAIPASTSARRPVILNRPFRSVGELGSVYRDLPFRSLDFWSAESADTALLDLFAVKEEPSVAAGKINLSNAPGPVIQAIIAGTMKNESNSLTLPNSDAQTIANGLVSGTPLRNPGDLVTALSTCLDSNLGGTSPIQDLRNKYYGESPLRALSSVTNARTWNLMVDVIAQTGTFTPNSPATASALNSSFVVQGERRYWMHLAIDRLTGKVIDSLLEPVYE